MNETPSWELRLDPRAQAILDRLGCQTIADVASLTRTVLERYRRFGVTAAMVDQIEAALARHGLAFATSGADARWRSDHVRVVAALAAPVRVDGGLWFEVVHVVDGGAA